MPELPEVEICRHNLTAWTVGARVVGAAALDSARFEGHAAQLVGREVSAWERHGKYLVARLSGGLAVVSHLGMTGKWVRDDDASRAHRRVVLTVAGPGGEVTVALVDPRRFGWTWILAAADLTTHPRLARLGLDALDPRVDGAHLQARLGRSRAPLKPRLLDQAVVAGLGNIAVVEAAWRAGVHPHAPCRAVDAATWGALAEAVREHVAHVLEVEGGDEVAYLSERGATNPFLCYGHAGEPCPRCAAPLARGAVGGRPSFWCPRCQPEVT